jgi:hypothetical protein
MDNFSEIRNKFNGKVSNLIGEIKEEGSFASEKETLKLNILENEPLNSSIELLRPLLEDMIKLENNSFNRLYNFIKEIEKLDEIIKEAVCGSIIGALVDLDLLVEIE